MEKLVGRAGSSAADQPRAAQGAASRTGRSTVVGSICAGGLKHSHYFAVHTRRGLKEWRGFAWRQPRHTTALARRAAASSDSFVEERPLLAKESEEAETWPHRTYMDIVRDVRYTGMANRKRGLFKT